MTFADAIKTVLSKYAEFSGRASRAEYWWWILFTVLVSLILGSFNVIHIGDHSTLGSLLSGIWSLATFLPSLAVAVRRLRDAGYSWGHLFWLLIPIAGAIVLIVLLAQPSKKEA